MNKYVTCPACTNPIAPDRQIGHTFICPCGWSGTSEERALEDQGLKFDRSSLFIIFLALFTTGAFIHSINWDSHSFAIVPLKAAQFAGVASVDDLNKIAEICHERKKYTCEAKAYFEIYQKDNNQVEVLNKLGKLQVSLEDFSSALKTYQSYFKNGGKDIEAHYQYAKALHSHNMIDEAAKHYRKVLKAKPGTLQVTVTRSFVKMLMDNKKWTQAKRVINYWRKKGSNTSMFLDGEMKKINQELNGRRLSSDKG